MNNLLIRRRVLMAIGGAKKGGYVIPKRGQYAVTAEENPKWMSFLYQNGVAANPNYCTFEEAAAVENFSGMQNPTGLAITHVDLRYFTGLHGIGIYGLPMVSSSCKKFTLPDAAGAMKIDGNGSFSAANPYILVIPASVEHFHPSCINASYSHAIYIFEGTIPPSHDWYQGLKNAGGGGTLDAIFVPDSAVNTYKTTYVDKGNTNQKYYSNYADIIFPHSAYVEPTE